MASDLRQSVLTREILWYLSGGLGDDERLEFAETSHGVVLRGDRGAAAAAKLRQRGYDGYLLLDPAAYERGTRQAPPTLFGDHWLSRERELGVGEYLSPGRYVPAGDVEALKSALEVESKWLDIAGSGRLSLAIDARWLTRNVDVLAGILQDSPHGLALALGHRNDPLALNGAVSGMVTLVSEVENVALLRGDLSALGAVAFGATLGAVGTSAAVRHVVPPEQSAGGVPGDRSPSVFVPDILDFRLGSFLDSLPKAASPVCTVCCGGEPLRRFNDEHTVRDARRHNRAAMQHVVSQVLGQDVSNRAAAFVAMCRSAEYQLEALAVAARRPLDLRPQIRAWAHLT